MALELDTNSGIVPGPRIAAIDDSPELLQLMRALLQDEGYVFEGILTIEGAHQRLRVTQPSALILDVMMSEGEGGWRFLQELKNDPETANIPVILCTGASYFLEKHRDQITEFDCRILPKPFDLDEMLRSIQLAIGGV